MLGIYFPNQWSKVKPISKFPSNEPKFSWVTIAKEISDLVVLFFLFPNRWSSRFQSNTSQNFLSMNQNFLRKKTAKMILGDFFFFWLIKIKK
jgi:hypothetical protein